jgi:hypothetical protein
MGFALTQGAADGAAVALPEARRPPAATARRALAVMPRILRIESPVPTL